MERKAFLALAAAVVAGAALAVPAALASGRPDDRAGPRGADVTAVTPAAPTTAIRPDDRAGPRGVIPIAAESGTDWARITGGIAAGVALVLVGAGVLYALRHGGGWHLPHRPVRTH